MTTRTSDRRPRSGVILWVVAGLVTLVVVVAAVVGALREPTVFDTTVPEGVVQQYVQAVLDGDYRAALQWMTDESAATCGPSDFRDVWVPESLTVTLDDVRTTDGEAEVRVRLRSMAGPPPFGDGSYESDEAFYLVEGDGGWRLTGEPWPLYHCEGRR
jgi:hypothetical protein